MSYEDVKNHEENIRIAKEVDFIYDSFFKNIVLKASDYDVDKKAFEIWSYLHNAKYISIEEGVFCYECCFLHEHYKITINKSRLFEAIKNKERVIDHLNTDIN